jgi:hypothetical protein
MEHYVTLFDSLFLPQGLALHISMERHIQSYTLWILCVDDDAYDVLIRLNLPNVQLLQLSKLESPELQTIKPTRGKGEYCWTLTPFAPRFVFEADSEVTRLTYLDADLWFRKNPAPIFKEFDLSGKHALITDHGYAPEFDYSAETGQYCVQFMTFTRNGGEVVRKWWEERCVEWCFARLEEGKFGDQKYLDDWPIRFERFVHVLERQEWSQAPWNASRFPFSQGIFFHFHGLRIAEGRRIDFGPIYGLPHVLIKNVYEPYIDDLKEAINILQRYQIIVKPQIKKQNPMTLLKRFLSGIYHQFWRFHTLNFRKY